MLKQYIYSLIGSASSVSQREKGYLWFYSSEFSYNRVWDNQKKHSQGHMGISFQDIDFNILGRVSDDDHKIYGFLPNPINPNETSKLTDNSELFLDFFKNSNIHDPIYKLEIEFDHTKKNMLFTTKSTYSLPVNDTYNLPNKHFTLNFRKIEIANNCITFIINILQPTFFKQDKQQELIVIYEKINSWGILPGGYISLFIKKYESYSQKVFYKAGHVKD